MRTSKAESKQTVAKQRSSEIIGDTIEGGKYLVDNSLDDTYFGDPEAEFQDLPHVDKPQFNCRRAIEKLLEKRKLLRDQLEDSFEYLN